MIITYQPAATSTLPAQEGRRSSAVLCSHRRRDPRSVEEEGMRNFEARPGLRSQIHLSVGSQKVKVDHEHENRPNKMTTYLKERKEWCLTWYQDKDPRTIWVGAPKRWKLTTKYDKIPKWLPDGGDGCRPRCPWCQMWSFEFLLGLRLAPVGGSPI